MDSQKRAAIQISGEFRCLNLTTPLFFKNIVEPLIQKGYHVYIFIHTWRRQKSSYGTWEFEGRGNWHEYMPVFSTDEGFALFNPSAFLVENLEEKDFLKGRSRILAMYYSIYMSNQIRRVFEDRNKISFDLIVRYRTDCHIEIPMFETIPDLSSFLVIPRSSKVYQQDDSTAIHDLLAYGTNDCMNIYSDTFLMWLPISDTPIGEVCLKSQLDKHSLVPIRPFFPFYLVEGNGQIRGKLRTSLEN